MADSRVTSVQNQFDPSVQKPIKCGSIAGVIIGWIFAAFWNAISWFGLIKSVQVDNSPFLIMLVFACIGLLLIAMGVYFTIGFARFGTSEFLMAHPAEPGGTLSGVVRTKTKVLPDDGFTLDLQCQRRRTRGKDRFQTRWKAEQQSVASLGTSADPFSAIPVQFEIPADAEATGRRQTYHYLWTLTATGKVKGVDFRASFQVPISENQTS